jgi:hypothetical protein
MSEEKEKVKFSLDLVEPGDILQYRNDGSKFGNLIEKKQLAEMFDPIHACYTHVEVSGGGKDSVNITIPKAKHIDIAKAHKGRYVRVLQYRHFTEKQRDKAAYYSALLCGEWYDLGGIGAFCFKWLRQNNRHFFCSEGCALSYKMVSKKVFGSSEPSSIYPADFNSLKGFDCKCEGVIC